MTRKANKKGRSKESDHFTKIHRSVMETPAWPALSPVAQALYLWLKFEWRGDHFNNNGKIRLSCRQAADRVGVSINTAARAFRDLQAKGFIVVTVMGALGTEGLARGPSYELTELPRPASASSVARMLYKTWRPGQDFPVARHNANNPRGRNGKRKTRRKNQDGPVTNIVTFRPTPSSKP
ncbi:MAG: hypothetical protein KF769_10430 [Parvibaculum sp.]|nr:hypothetical protein [Parvibaculum sp.]